jgi:MoaA/NifB/PqqE/SkfB family radical SAM enzyme
MELHALHILLTYQCNLKCDHCFVWGSNWQPATMSMRNLDRVLVQAKMTPSCEWIYFEGGEPFLFYPLLRHGVETAKEMGFRVGLVSNGYWATNEWDAVEWLRPFKGLVEDLTISSDLYHWEERLNEQARHAELAARQLEIPIGVISMAKLDQEGVLGTVGMLPEGEAKVMYRGRAAEKLAPGIPKTPWQDFTECPYENLKDPGRVHLDPLGNLHVCQGISIGNLFETPLKEICDTYRVDEHPIAGPIQRGGPAELVRRRDVRVEEGYADACHLCYKTREMLRTRYPEILTPDQMYGDVEPD